MPKEADRQLSIIAVLVNNPWKLGQAPGIVLSHAPSPPRACDRTQTLKGFECSLFFGLLGPYNSSCLSGLETQDIASPPGKV